MTSCEKKYLGEIFSFVEHQGFLKTPPPPKIKPPQNVFILIVKNPGGSPKIFPIGVSRAPGVKISLFHP